MQHNQHGRAFAYSRMRANSEGYVPCSTISHQGHYAQRLYWRRVTMHVRWWVQSDIAPGTHDACWRGYATGGI